MNKTKYFSIISGLVFLFLALLSVFLLLYGEADFTFNGKTIENKYWASAICVGLLIVVWGIFTTGAYIAEKVYEAFTDSSW